MLAIGLYHLINSLLHFIPVVLCSQQIAIDLHKSKEHQRQLHDNAKRIRDDGRSVVSSIAKDVDKKVKSVLNSVASQLTDVVDNYDDVDFDKNNPFPYKEVRDYYFLQRCEVLYL